VIRMGLVDLDSSNVAQLVARLKDHSDIAIAAVWDGGSVHAKGYAAEFARRNGIARVCETLEEMADAVDVALILGVDWDFHLMRAEPFVRAGKSVFINKPAAGKAAHCNRLIEWQRDLKARIMTGGAYRYADEVRDIVDSPQEFGRVRSISVTAPGHVFYHGIHAAEMLQEIAGPGARCVRFVASSGPVMIFSIDYDDGPACLLELRAPSPSFRLYVGADGKSVSTSIESDPYNAFVSHIADFARGGDAPVRLEEALEPVRLLIAAKCAAGTRDPVFIDNLHKCSGFDGWEFADACAREAGCR